MDLERLKGIFKDFNGVERIQWIFWIFRDLEGFQGILRNFKELTLFKFVWLCLNYAAMHKFVLVLLRIHFWKIALCTKSSCTLHLRCTLTNQLDGSVLYFWSFGQVSYSKIDLSVCALPQLPSPTKALLLCAVVYPPPLWAFERHNIISYCTSYHIYCTFSCII